MLRRTLLVNAARTAGVLMMATVPLVGQIEDLSPPEIADEYKKDMARVDKAYAEFPGAHAFVKTVYDTRFVWAIKAFDDFDYVKAARARDSKNFSYPPIDLPTPVTDNARWGELAMGIETERMLQDTITRGRLNFDFEQAIFWHEAATMAFIRQSRKLLDPDSSEYDYYDDPKKQGVSEDQQAAMRKFTPARLDKRSDYGALAKLVPSNSEYVLELYTQLSKESGCHDYKEPMRTLVTVHHAVMERYLKGLKWSRGQIKKEFSHPGTYELKPSRRTWYLGHKVERYPRPLCVVP